MEPNLCQKSCWQWWQSPARSGKKTGALLQPRESAGTCTSGTQSVPEELPVAVPTTTRGPLVPTPFQSGKTLAPWLHPENLQRLVPGSPDQHQKSCQWPQHQSSAKAVICLSRENTEVLALPRECAEACPNGAQSAPEELPAAEPISVRGLPVPTPYRSVG